MSYIFGDLKTKLQTQVGDPALNDSVCGDAINYTQQNIFNTFDLTLNSAQQTKTVIAGANTLASSLATDFQRVSSLYITSPTGLARNLTPYFVSAKDFRELYPLPSIRGRGPLESWTYWTSIEFSNLADQNYTIKIDYIKYVPILSLTSDIPTVPEAFEELLMLGAKIRIYEQKEDFDYASQYQNRYSDLLEAFVTRYSTGQVDNQMVVPGSRSRVSGR